MNHKVKCTFSLVARVSKFFVIFVLIHQSVGSEDEKQNAIVEYLAKNNFLHGKAEIVFLLDRSGSVGAANFEIEKGFVESFLTHIVVDVNASRVSVISYSDFAVRHIDYLREPKTKCFLSQELQDVRFKDSRATNIAAAFDEAELVFQNARPNVKKVLVLISDGLATVGGDPKPSAIRLKSSGVEIFCFGVGKFLKTELEDLASSKQHVYSCLEFRHFKRLAQKIRGDPHEISWSGQADKPNCDHLCDSFYKGLPEDPGCCDHHARCSCALLSGMHTCVCGPGYFGLSGLAGHCRGCPIGTYKSSLEPTRQCTLCPESSTTAEEASTSIRDCYCKDGYEGNPAEGVPCTLKKCPPLQTPTHGYILFGYCESTYGSRCHFTCEEGYELVHQASDGRTCQMDGTWSGKTALCQRIRCKIPRKPLYGERHCEDGELAVGRKCRFGCDRGYIMKGSYERECLSDKKWSGFNVECIPVECGLPPQIKDGYTNCWNDKKVKFFETCAYRCNDGFRLNGPMFLVCRENGKMLDPENNSDVKPSCIDNQPPEITCPRPILVNTAKGESTALVTWKIPQPIDNSGIVARHYAYPPNIHPPVYLPIGRTSIQYIAVDETGLKSYCQLEIEVYDNEAPAVISCPPKVEISTDDVQAQAFWKEPVFQDNSGYKVAVRQTARPGDKFRPGRHTVTYQAFDGNNNMAQCVFDVIITRNTCPYHPPPTNGALACDDYLYGQICQTLCDDRYDFVDTPAEWYVCSSDSQWITEPENMPIPWPDCARPAFPGKIRRMVKGFYYQGDCNDPYVQAAIKKMFLSQLSTQFQKFEICRRQNACTMETVKVMCGSITDHMNPKRFRRDVWKHAEKEELELEFEITLDVDQELNDTEAMLQDFLETIQNLKWDTDDFMLQSTTLAPDVDDAFSNQTANTPGTVIVTEESTVVICKAGSVFNNDTCVRCPPGTYYETSSQECWDCPLGQYQEDEGQLDCKVCPPGASTESRRSRNQTECKGICLSGTYSLTGLETCMVCSIGAYQEHVGQISCNLCPEGTTTSSVGSTFETDCKSVCEPGSYSKTTLKPCKLCEVGYFQPLSGQKLCLECPENFLTLSEGAHNLSHCLDVDPCLDVNLCRNGGVCRRVSRNGICECKDGFAGERCERDIDECERKPCFNGGHCINEEGSYYCNCRDGFVGKVCDVEVDDCLSSPCTNNGTCFDKVNGYVCVCPAGYEGPDCEVIQEMCFRDIVCQNGGICKFKDGSNETFCGCQPGYEGIDCSMDINDCKNVTCHNNGRCVDAISSYTCVCVAGYIGDFCEVEVDECEFNQCQSGSKCKDLVGSYECLCPPGWSGDYCETKLDDDFVLHFPESTATIADMATMTVSSALSDVTISVWVQTTDTARAGTPVSYAVASATTGDGAVVDNALTISDCSGIRVYVNNEPMVTDVQVTDGDWHHLAFTWSSENSGEWNLYKDGQLQSHGTNLRSNDVISGGGTMVIGQDQDMIGGGFSPVETFTGNITRVNVWNRSFSKGNITRLCILDDDIPGKVVAWPDFLEGVKGNVNIINNVRPFKVNDVNTM